MRWWKTFREDMDRPAFQAGIERFGTGFAHDVFRTWQMLCVEDGPGIRAVALTPEMLSAIARQFRVATPEEARERLAFMSANGLIELKGSDLEMKVTSRELKRRRDEWSRRKARLIKDKDGAAAQESLRSRSRETPEQRQMQRAEAEVEAVRRTETPNYHPDRQAFLKRLKEKIAREDGETAREFLNDLKVENADGYQEFVAAFNATGFKPVLSDGTVGVGFLMIVAEVFYEQESRSESGDLTPGNLCSRIIDACMKSKPRIPYPPSFVEHRDKLREVERQREQSAA